MLDDLTELKTFRAIATAASLTAAARDLGVTLAVVSKRLAALERRAGLRLVSRTTRSLSLTEEGERLLPDVERALEAIAAAEETISTGRSEPIGTLRVTAPVSFGKRHVAPILGQLGGRHPRLAIALSLRDDLVDIVRDGFDVAIRIGELADSSATMRKLADNRRILAAAPTYLDRFGRPGVPADLVRHAFLRYEMTAQPWRLVSSNGLTETVYPGSRLHADSGDVVHDWAIAGCGIMLKSMIDVAGDLRAGRLERVLPGWDGGTAPIVALTRTGRQAPLKVRVFLDALSLALRGGQAVS